MKRLLLIYMLLFPFLALAQQDSGLNVTFLTKANINASLIKHWRFANGDGQARASIGYDDSRWAIMPTALTIENIEELRKTGFTGLGWFRLHFVVDTTVAHMQLALGITHYGASQLYLDGRLLKEFGEINGKDSSRYYDPLSLPFTLPQLSAGPHVLAVRYANYNIWRNFHAYHRDFGGFLLRISPADSFIESTHSQTISISFVLVLLLGIFTALSMLHLFLYLYYRSARTNLYFSIFCLCIGAMFLSLLIGRFSHTPGTQLGNNIFSLFVWAGSCFSLSGFINELFSRSRLRFRIITAICIISPLLWFADSEGFNFLIVLVSLSCIVTLEAVVMTILGIVRKVKGARIIGFGILFFALFFLTIAVITVIMDGVYIDDTNWTGQLAELVAAAAVLSIPVSMSVYLAWSFSAINRDLKSQLDNVQVLSERTLEQEKEKKLMLEEQNAHLEEKVNERTREVMEQKELIERKNKAITDNVMYAQRIQSAILPDIKLIYKTLEQSFILYLPKDIVSGDFYAFAERDGRVLMIAGDCTGHGVSGAFMSMIGSSLLNQIINEKGITQPSLILDQLNRLVIETFKQSEHESNDGMDISICSFDLAGMTLDFAGANRPLWLIRNNELTTLKPDKLPIGGLQMARDRTFTNVTMKLQPGDTIYIFTDGYADQFGGPKGKKLMTTKFRELLLAMQGISLRQQEDHLKEHFEQWKGTQEQVDDVLVIGIRV